MKIDNDVNIASLMSGLICKLINRKPGLRLLISSLPGSSSRTDVESLCKPQKRCVSSGSAMFAKINTFLLMVDYEN